MRKKFRLSHSLLGGAALLVIEGVWVRFVLADGAGLVAICLAAVIGSLIMLYLATEIIEEVRGTRHMLLLLSAVVAEFVIFYAFQYWFLLALEPASFPTLREAWVPLLLHSTMVFVFNPIYLPATLAGQALLLINTLFALGLVLFVLQNVWQFRRSQ